ncbi:hypothetical protein GUITHDRAFT_107142 [Guillardia theta CCMP2712]|uniref:Mre11 DNA-binding domain-containing protein n=1 Tax=Guillardia theta (strain CCMP2712) TaxID=905079 RepID=L1JFF3_GUITC|nr:hypothetical protein GUITHDRAFT_107142 [Guillardia theta CCMP2712]EKX47231.1 hypothetical protein GUITHDRAFT_107142 [Guillardia theta CCMP2712]|eukprot:XP_005834211.1 hypothetical protein GUITHDRAFT_107142 [Guillardia theta CCMP2712]
MAVLDIRLGKHGEYQTKHVKIRHQNVRPFIYEECNLSLQDPKPKQNEEGVKAFLVEKVPGLSKLANEFWRKSKRLKQEETSSQRQNRPVEILEGVDMNTLIEEELENMEKSKKSGLQLLSRNEILNAVKEFVDKDENKSIGGMVASTMKELEELVGNAETYKAFEDENDCLEKLKPFLEQRQSKKQSMGHVIIIQTYTTVKSSEQMDCEDHQNASDPDFPEQARGKRKARSTRDDDSSDSNKVESPVDDQEQYVSYGAKEKKPKPPSQNRKPASFGKSALDGGVSGEEEDVKTTQRSAQKGEPTTGKRKPAANDTTGDGRKTKAGRWGSMK